MFKKSCEKTYFSKKNFLKMFISNKCFCGLVLLCKHGFSTATHTQLGTQQANTTNLSV